jgi:hypothetical protein
MTYGAQIIQDLPDLQQIAFPVPGRRGRDTVHVVVRPSDSEPWVGLFYSDGFSDVSDLQTWNDGLLLLVVARGYPHLVSAHDPSQRVEVPVFPVRHVLRHESGLVVLGDFVRICGVQGNGIRWVSPPLGHDWLDDVRLDGDFVVGRGSNNASGDWSPFKVSILDGNTETEWAANSGA